MDRKKILIAGIALLIVLLGAVGVVVITNRTSTTAPVAPTAPESQPEATFYSCTMEFTVTASPTPTPTPVPQCGSTCTTNSNCGTGMTCSNGICRNPSCTSSTTCICPTPTPTATPTPTPPTNICVLNNISVIPSPDATAWNTTGAFTLKNTGTSTTTFNWFLDAWTDNSLDKKGTLTLKPGETKELGLGKICSKWQLDIGCPPEYAQRGYIVESNQNACVTPTPTVSPSPTPTPTPSPTPTPVVACNSVCNSNDQCPSDLICESGRCRRPGCTAVDTCSCGPSCNSSCSTNSDCPSDLICASGMCRRAGCTAVDSCNCGPTVTATPESTTTVVASGNPVTTLPQPLPVSGAPLPTIGLIVGGIVTILIGVLGLLAL